MSRQKKQPSWWIAFVLLVGGLFAFLNQMRSPVVPEPPAIAGNNNDPEIVEHPVTISPQLPPASPDRFTLASFNIQVFGQSKLNDQQVMSRLAEVVRQFDLVAIQEIRSVDQNVLPAFVERINRSGVQYQFVISPRLGRTVSQEQYAFVYRADRFEPIPNSVFNINDPEDRLHREPFVSSFRTRIRQGLPFTFTLINAHTDPDEAEWEVSQLGLVYEFVNQFHRQEDDILMLGDLNVSFDKLSGLASQQRLISLIPPGPTNTRRTAQYDYILASRLQTTEFTGRAGVLDLESLLGISQEQALELSDHLPVWAEFQMTESAAGIHMADPGRATIVR